MSDRPLFLERASYHRRRLGDAARVLPVLAVFLVLVPVWWVPAKLSYAAGLVWFIALWAMLVFLIWALHRALLRAESAALDTDPTGPEGADGF